MTDVYQFNPAMEPDSAFVPGTLDLLVPGNVGRVLDPRRTPFRVVEIRREVGFFVLEITGFEDQGAHWEVPFESVDRYQFSLGSKRAPEAEAAAYAEVSGLLDQPLEIPIDPSRREGTQKKLTLLEREVAVWLSGHGRFRGLAPVLADVPMEGPRALREDLERFMQAHGLSEIETAFATQYVRNPYSGEMVKAHRIVIAELGLVPFAGKIVRDPSCLQGSWSREVRGEHVLRRMSFLRARFAAEGVDRVVLYRGLSCEGQPKPPRNDTFVSATFHRHVALAHFNERDHDRTGLLTRQRVSVERLFMTYLETGAMNERFKEAEAVLMVDPGNAVF